MGNKNKQDKSLDNLSDSKKVKLQKTRLENYILDVEKKDGARAGTELLRLIRFNKPEYCSRSEINALYVKAANRYGKTFIQTVYSAGLGNDYYTAFEAALRQDKYDKALGIIDRGNRDEAVYTFNRLVELSKTGKGLTVEQTRELYLKAETRYGKEFSDAAEESLGAFFMYQNELKRAGIRKLIDDPAMQDPEAASKAFIELLEHNGKNTQVSSDGTVKLFVDAAEKFGMTFIGTVLPKLRENGTLKEKIEMPSIEDLRVFIGVLERGLIGPDMTQQQAEQFADVYSSVKESLKNIKGRFSKDTGYAREDDRLSAVAERAMYKLGDAFKEQYGAVKSFTMKEQCFQFKQDIAGGASAEKAAAGFARLMKLWKENSERTADRIKEPNGRLAREFAEGTELVAKAFDVASKTYGEKAFSDALSAAYPQALHSEEYAELEKSVNNVQNNIFIKKPAEPQQLSKWNRAYARMRELRDIINDPEKIDAKEASDAFNRLMDVTDLTSHSAEAICDVYFSALRKYSYEFAERAEARIKDSFIYKDEYELAFKNELLIEMQDLIAVTPADDAKAVISPFKVLIEKSAGGDGLSVKQIRGLAAAAAAKFKDAFTNAVKEDLDKDVRYQTELKRAEAADIVENTAEKDPDKAAKAIRELIAQNKAGGGLAEKDICDLYLNAADKFGIPFMMQMENEHPEGGKPEKSELYNMLMRSSAVEYLDKAAAVMERKLRNLKPEEHEQFTSFFYSVNDSEKLRSAAGSKLDSVEYTAKYMRLNAVSVDAAEKIGSSFWENHKKIWDHNIRGCIFAGKQKIDNASDAREAALAYGNALKMWSRFYEENKLVLRSPESEAFRDFKEINRQMALAFLFAEEKFGEEFSRSFEETVFSAGNDQPAYQHLAGLVSLGRAEKILVRVEEAAAAKNAGNSTVSAESVCRDIANALKLPGKVDKKLERLIPRAAEVFGGDFGKEFGKVMAENPMLSARLYKDSADEYIARQERERADELQKAVNDQNVRNPLAQFSELLNGVKRWSDSKQYRDLCTLVENLGKNNLAVTDPGSLGLKDEYKGLSDVQIKALPYVFIHDAISSYLEHKAKDGVNTNSFDKMDVIERLNSYVSAKIEDLDPDDFTVPRPGKENEMIDFKVDNAHSSYRREYLAVRRRVATELKSGAVPGLDGYDSDGKSLADVSFYIKDTSGKPYISDIRLEGYDYDKVVNVKSCMDRIMLKAQAAGVRENAEKLINGEKLASTVPEHLRDANRKITDKSLFAKKGNSHAAEKSQPVK